MSFEAESNSELTVTVPYRLFEIRRTIGQKITRTGNTAKYAGPGVRLIVLFVYFVLHRKSEMQQWSR
jgi:hypothetical protein